MKSVLGIWVASRLGGWSKPELVLRALFVSGLCLLAIGCGQEPASLELPAVAPTQLRAPNFSVMSFHLGDRYASAARFPEDAALPEPVIRKLAQTAPDLLAVYGFSDETGFTTFRSELAEAGLPYPHYAILESETSERGLAVLSRHPPMLRQSHTDDSYRIGDNELRIEPGVLDLTFIIDGRFLLRLYTADLVEKTFHRLGQAEMRRNEARLLAQRVNRALRDQPDLPILLACALSDVRDSAPFRELTERRSDLIALDPRDRAGNAWTWREPEGAAYHAHDFFFVSASLAERFEPESTLVLEIPELLAISPHRPILATFRLGPE